MVPFLPLPFTSLFYLQYLPRISAPLYPSHKSTPLYPSHLSHLSTSLYPSHISTSLPPPPPQSLIQVVSATVFGYVVANISNIVREFNAKDALANERIGRTLLTTLTTQITHRLLLQSINHTSTSTSFQTSSHIFFHASSTVQRFSCILHHTPPPLFLPSFQPIHLLTHPLNPLQPIPNTLITFLLNVQRSTYLVLQR